MNWFRKRLLWWRLDMALLFMPRDMHEATLETWLDLSIWQQRENEQHEWKQWKDRQ